MSIKAKDMTPAERKERVAQQGISWKIIPSNQNRKTNKPFLH